ncbi:MAG TPA: hypothetical protein DCG28_06605 [Lachnospiraceae bacterium]|nr:hypothetical protein [Lachnospiraceae bacterium]
MSTAISFYDNFRELFSSVFGMDIYFFLNCFFIYSFLGWIFESIVISYEEKKPVNRGFTRGPFCVIYGVGALGSYFLFKPFADHKILLFIVGSIIATIFEYFVAKLMIRLFGGVWWNYDNKKFNYKGILCLQSSICWGVMVLLTFVFFQPTIESYVNIYYENLGQSLGLLVLFIYIVDFATSFKKAYSDKDSVHTSADFKSISDVDTKINKKLV